MKEICYYTSPVGCIVVEIENNALVSVSLNKETTGTNSSLSDLAQKTIGQLDEYFAGQRRDFDLPLSIKGTPFQNGVWNELTHIPYGETISYQQLAARTGNDKACRAVGNANGKNPICFIIPCHRVVQASGKTGGYAYGTDVKEFLLRLEKAAL